MKELEIIAPRFKKIKQGSIYFLKSFLAIVLIKKHIENKVKQKSKPNLNKFSFLKNKECK